MAEDYFAETSRPLCEFEWRQIVSSETHIKDIQAAALLFLAPFAASAILSREGNNETVTIHGVG